MDGASEVHKEVKQNTLDRSFRQVLSHHKDACSNLEKEESTYLRP